MVLAWDDGDAQAESLQKSGVVGRLRLVGMGEPQRRGAECLWRLDCHQLTADESVYDMAVTNALDRVGDRNAWNGSVGPDEDSVDDSTEQLAV